MREMRLNVSLSVLLVLLLFAGSPAVADTTGGIRGRVIDSPGASVEAGATVSVQSRGGYTASAISSARGDFALIGLPPDQYYVTVKLADGRYGGCIFVIVPIFAGEVRTVNLQVYPTTHLLLSCRAWQVSSAVDSDQTLEVHSFGPNGNLLR